MKRLILFISLISTLFTSAQEKIFTEDELIYVMAKFHPLAKQAFIDVEMAKAGILSSRGVFDPQLTRNTANKEFGGIKYYDRQTTEIKVPTWYGIDLFAGKEEITGSRVNPQETQGSVSYVGISIQPLQNLLMDSRRATLLKAKNYHLQSQVQRQIVVNDLLQEALFAYWEWWEKYQVQKMVKAALINAEKRFSMVKTAVQLGDRPAIDTLEAFTQVQSFQIRMSEAYLNLVKANLQLSTFLWTENGGPAELPVNAIPQDIRKAESISLSDVLNAASAHPELRTYQFKLAKLQIDKKMAIQSLLPEVKLKYNQTGYNFSKTVDAPWFDNNYRFGVDFSMPLRLSEGRGDYKRSTLQIERTGLDQANKQLQLYTKVKQYYTEWQQTAVQLSLQSRLLDNTNALQKGEEIRFTNGESSLFLLNARELKTIETQQKVIELKAKVQKANIGVRWSAGILSF